MTDSVKTIGGVRIYVRPANAQPIATDRDASDLIGEVFGMSADWIAIPVAQLAPDFFKLRSGLAGAVTQKLVNYGLRAAVVGDISEQIAASTALRDFVVESNRGRHIWFVPDMAELEARLVTKFTPQKNA